MDEMYWLGDDIFVPIEYLDNEGNQIASELIGHNGEVEIWLDYN